MKMLLSAVLVDALHAAFEHGAEAFHCVRVDKAAHVLAAAVAGEIVLGEASA